MSWYSVQFATCNTLEVYYNMHVNITWSLLHDIISTAKVDSRSDIDKQGKSEGFDSCNWPSSLLKLESNRWFFSPCDLQIWRITPKNNRAHLLHYIKLCASFQIYQWIQTGVTVWKCLIWVKMDDFFSRVTLKFDGWPWKTIGHLFYATLSFGNHFVATGEFKLELQSGNAQFGSNSTVFRAKRNWNLMDDLKKQ